MRKCGTLKSIGGNWMKRSRSPALEAFFRILAIAGMTAAADAQFFQSPESWRKTHDLKNRYEGLLTTPTAANPKVLTLLSFTGAVTPYAGGEEWQVRFYSPETVQAVVSARDVEDAYQYWMESHLLQNVRGWFTFTGWNTSDVLVHQGIPANIIGIIVSLNGDNHNLAPAFVFPASKPLPENLELDAYNLRIRSEVRLDAVIYTLSQVQNGRRISVKGIGPVSVTAGSAFVLKLDVHSLSEGPVSVGVGGFKNGTTEPLASCEFRFFHQKAPR